MFGVAGILVLGAGALGVQVVGKSWFFILLTGIFIGLFAWAIFTGFQLWDGTPYGRKWAIILFAFQIPVLSLSGFEYQWSTGLYFDIIFQSINNSVNMNWEAGIGTAYKFHIGTGAAPIAIGVNLFAVIALILLIHANNSFKSKPLLSSS